MGDGRARPCVRLTRAAAHGAGPSVREASCCTLCSVIHRLGLLPRVRSSLALLAVSTTTYVIAEGDAWAVPAYVRSTVGQPWGSTTNEEAMDSVFGLGLWEDLRYETVDPDTLFSPTYTFLYLEGSDNNADELNAFLAANQTALEDWVDAGGTLFLNAAPNEGGDQDWGFGGVTLTRIQSDFGSATDALHPIWNGPFTPVSTNFTGNSYAHADVAGPGLVSVINNGGGTDQLAELDWGSGRIMFGGLTTDNYWDPQPDCHNLRINIIFYLAAGDGDEDGFDDFEDNCPQTANPGQEDGDDDEYGDACDACPADAADHLDTDADGLCDNADNCSEDANPGQENQDGDAAGDVCDACPADGTDILDSDGDLLCNNDDDCPFVADPGQLDGDADGVGDACDGCPIDPDNDVDGDGDCGNVDNCPNASNSTQVDSDGDGAGDACDVCDDDPLDDVDGDGVCGDVDNCPDDANGTQVDVDDDGVGDACDACPGDTTNDFDGDGVCGDVDNCPVVPNPDQTDDDMDGMGAACDADDVPDTTSTSGADTGSEESSSTGSVDETSSDGGSLTTTDGESSSEGGTTIAADSSGGDGSDTSAATDPNMQSEGDGGCACSTTTEGPKAWWLGLAVLGLRRRRRTA